MPAAPLKVAPAAEPVHDARKLHTPSASDEVPKPCPASVPTVWSRRWIHRTRFAIVSVTKRYGSESASPEGCEKRGGEDKQSLALREQLPATTRGVPDGGIASTQLRPVSVT